MKLNGLEAASWAKFPDFIVDEQDPRTLRKWLIEGAHTQEIREAVLERLVNLEIQDITKQIQTLSRKDYEKESAKCHS